MSSVRYGPSTAEYFVEFHVPPSDINGIASPAADEDRYKIIKSSLTNDYGEGTPDSGDDWAVFQVSPNSVTGLLPIDENAQDAYLNIKQTTNLDEIRITGYGKDSNDPRSSYTLQTAYGPDWGVMEIL